ncbi:MAG TPA: hypothetical protein VGQ83_00615, partial [Polyangia bacterium]
GAALLLLAGGAALVAGGLARAAAPEPGLAAARAAYSAALRESDRAARTRAFASAEASYRQLVEAHPDSAELLCDWGNAALGGQDLGRAVLAYRRALVLDPTLERARRNLAWVRGRLPESFPRPQATGALESFFFWHHRLTLVQRHVGAGVAFAALVLLLLPWPARPRRQRLARGLAVPVALVWLALAASAVLERDAARDAVLVRDGAVLRAADSQGAPAALAAPLPPGGEVTVTEERPGWTRITLADGARGWVADDAVARVQRR